MTLLEERRLSAQQELDSGRSAQERNKLGQFATPPHLARDIVQHAVEFLPKRSGRMRVLEPSCGTGAFISAVNECVSLGDAEITGVELDTAFANSARDIWGNRAKIIQDDFFVGQLIQEISLIS